MPMNACIYFYMNIFNSFAIHQLKRPLQANNMVDIIQIENYLGVVVVVVVVVVCV